MEYSDEEAEEILKRALAREKKEGISHDDLVAAAAEVGIDRGEVEAAAAELAREREKLARQTAARQELRNRLASYAWKLAVVNAVLIPIDYLTGPGWWIQWVVLGSVVMLAQRALRTFSPREEDLERAEQRLARRERRRQRRQRRRQRHRAPPAPRRKRAEAEFERVVEQGVEALLRGAADRIERFNREQNAQQRVRVDPDAGEEADDSSAAHKPHQRVRR